MKATWLKDGSSISEDVLADEGVFYRSLPLEEADYQPTMNELKEERGYIHQDIVALSPDTPELEALMAKFDGEHLHEEDEVRFVLEGAGIFDIRSSSDEWMRVVVEAGDLIVVPKDRHHRFELTAEKTIRCVRLFQDTSGWVPHYRGNA